MRLTSLLVLAVTALTTALPAPAPQYGSPQASPECFLRVSAQGKPWHNRHLIALPSTQYLGLENFTVHPITPPIYLIPVQIPGTRNYALQIPGSGDNLSRTPYLAAITDPSDPAASPVGLKVVYVSQPGTDVGVEGCLGGHDCVTDSFSFYGDGSWKGLAYAGFNGGWSAVKDAGTKGWDVYWTAGPSEGSIEIEVAAKTQAGY